VSLEVDLDAFAMAHACCAVVIDLREPYEYASGHVPGARLIPLGSLPVVPGRRESVA
jgi:rhodanese-related sulfurtransferase